jgi:hypothetical protein
MLLILAVAVGVLFAMCAELSQRISSSSGGAAPDTTRANGYVRPLDRPGVFLRPDVIWPPEFDGITSSDAFLLIVLSTSCTSCMNVASELGSEWTRRTAGRLGIVISTPDIHRGTSFVAEHNLGGIPHIIDEDGAWTTKALGLSLSPVGLIFIGNSLQGSYVFNRVELLWRSFTEEMAWTQNIGHDQQAKQRQDSRAEGLSPPSAPVA